MDNGLTKFLWIIALLGSLASILIEGWDWLLMFKEGSGEVWDDIDSLSDGMMWSDWGFGSVVIVDGRPEGVAIVLELVDLASV